jgi:hypothetical protein
VPLPDLSDSQVASIAAQVAAYIDAQRQAYNAAAVPITSGQQATMQLFFSTSTLNSTRLLVLEGQRVADPPFYSQLRQLGFRESDLPSFTSMAAITFVDTVVSHHPFTDSLLFHELVHVVQYEKLGLQQFATKYVTGFLRGGSYEDIPLEVNAYSLEARFGQQPLTPFPVAQDVQSWIAANRF